MTYVCVEFTDWYVLILPDLRSASVCLYYWCTNTFLRSISRVAKIVYVDEYVDITGE